MPDEFADGRRITLRAMPCRLIRTQKRRRPLDYRADPRLNLRVRSASLVVQTNTREQTMDTASVLRTPTPTSKPWQLQSRRTSHCMLRDKPIKGGSIAEIAQTLDETTKEKLRNVNIRSIDPVELSNFILMLHHEGYLAHEAFTHLGNYQLDYKGLIDPLKEARDGRESIRGVDDIMYALAIRHYETSIDALLGIERLTDYLNGRGVDVYA